MSTSLWNNSRIAGKSRPRPASGLHWIEQLASTWIGDMNRCLKDPGVEEVHRVRTGTRRLEAHLESLLEREKPRAGALKKSAESWMRQMKKIRRAAGVVRDLDVHRKLIEKFTGVGKAGRKLHEEGQQGALERATPIPQEKTLLEEQAERLDNWLRDARDHQASRLKKQIDKRLTRVEELSRDFLTAYTHRPSPAIPAPNPAAMALGTFARLSSSMPQLNAGNLHDFRKKAKKARYLTESAQKSAKAKEIGENIKQIQDAIGDWHDWLALTEEAQIALKEKEADLVKHLEEQVATAYEEALNTTEKLKSRLLQQAQHLGNARPRSRQKPRSR